MASSESEHSRDQLQEIKVLSSSEETVGYDVLTKESTPLLRNVRQRIFQRLRSKFRCRFHWCCLTSKAALLILLWKTIIVAGLESFIGPSYFGSGFEVADDVTTVTILSGITYSGLVFLFLFYPLAGYLADIRWGRYKTIINSLRLIWGSLVAMLVFAGVAIASIMISVYIIKRDIYNYPVNTLQIILRVVVCVVFGIPTFIALLLLLCGLVCFSANVIQYGMDQLHDAPTEDSVLYIHWYVWTSYAGILPMKLGFSISHSFFFYYSLCFLSLPLLFLGVTLCIQQYKRHWFLIDSGSRNPYKLVYGVLKFSKDHTNPIRRSAFTDCEDELPSRLDLGKEKYGGPFTTEQVEDVKAFLGILRVLLTLGPIMMVDFSVGGILSKFARHLDVEYNHNIISHKNKILLRHDTFTPLLRCTK